MQFVILDYILDKMFFFPFALKDISGTAVEI